MWSLNHSYKIIGVNVPIVEVVESSSWVTDWFNYSYSVCVNEGLSRAFSLLFAQIITFYIAHHFINFSGVASVNSIWVGHVLSNVMSNLKGSEREQKIMFFNGLLSYFLDENDESISRSYQIKFRIPPRIYDYLHKQSNIHDWLINQINTYQNYSEFKEYNIHQNKLKVMYISLTPCEHQKFKKIIGNTYSCKLINLYHDIHEREQRKKNRITTYNKYFGENIKT